MILDRVHAALFDGDRGQDDEAGMLRKGSEPGDLLIGAHRVLRRLGSGGMGEVYLAFNERLARLEALKVLRPSAGRDLKAQADLQREAQALARLSHPNVVQVHSADVSADGAVYLAMEFIEGPTLEDWQRAPGRSWREVVEAYVAAGQGLAAAHRAGLVHRDFKPSNVLMADGEGRPAERVKVIDFGLAVAELEEVPVGTTPAGSGERRSSAIIGTPYYLAPEQCVSRPTLTPKSDQFSFCVALYEALFRRHPFYSPQDSGQSRETTAGASRGQPPTNPPPFQSLVRAIQEAPLQGPPPDAAAPRRIFRIVARGLERAPEARHASMEALLDALGRELRPRPGRARLVAAAAAGLLVGAVGIGYYQKATEPEICRDPGAELEALWNDARAAELGDGPAARAVRRALGNYVSTWKSTLSAACSDTFTWGKLDRAAYLARVTCLDARKAALRETIGALEASPAALQRADLVLAGLPPISDCAALRAPVCGDPEALREVPNLAEELASARKAERAADYEEAAKRAAEARRLAEGRPELLAEAALLHGRALGELARFDGAEAALQAAYFAADQAGCEGLAVDAASRLAKTLALDPDPARVGSEWWQIALRKLERMPASTGPEEELRTLRWAEILNNRGLLRQRKLRDPECVREGRARCRTDLRGAEADFREALRLREEVAEPPWADLSVARCNLGAVLFLSGRTDEAFAEFQAGLAAIEAAFGPGHPASWKAHFDLGKAMVDAGRDEGAEAHLKEALRLAELALDAHNVGIGEVHLELAKLHDNLDRLEEAGKHAALAANIFRELGLPLSHPRLFNATRMLGYVEQVQGKYDAALLSRRALLEATPAADIDERMISHLELAETLDSREEWAEARRHAESAGVLADALELGPADVLRGEIQLYGGLALAGLRDGRALAALQEAQRVLKKNLDDGVIDPVLWGHATWALTKETCAEVPRELREQLDGAGSPALKSMAQAIRSYDPRTCTPLTPPP